MSLAVAFARSASAHAGKPAVFWGEKEHTYERLLKQSQQLAAHLHRDLGIKFGDRVAIWLKNCREFVPAMFGVFLSGAVMVPINNFLKPEELNYILSDAGIDVIITDASAAEHLAAVCAARPQLKVWQVEEFARWADAATAPAAP